MVKIINDIKTLYPVKPSEPTKEEIQENERIDLEFRKITKLDELINVLEEELPKFYNFKENGIGVSIYKKRLKFLKKQRSLASISLYRVDSNLEDEITVYRDDSVLINIAKKIAEKYEKIKGKEMNIRLTWDKYVTQGAGGGGAGG